MKNDEQKKVSNKELENLIKEITQMAPKQNKNSGKQTIEKTNIDNLIKELEQINDEIKQNNKPVIGSHRAPEAVLTKLIEQLEQSNKETKQGKEKIKEPIITENTKQKDKWQGIKNTLNKFTEKSNSLTKNVVDNKNIVKQQVGKTINKLSKKVTNMGR